MTEVVQVSVAGGVARLTLDSPGNRNALSEGLRAHLLSALRSTVSDGRVRAILLTHTGPVFCSGMDLTETRRLGTPAPGLAELAKILQVCAELTVPIVARVAGPARAGGLGLLAAADIVLASSAADFAFTEVRLGLVPATIMPPVLRRVPVAVARQLMLTGEVFDADRALQIGLVNQVTAPDLLDAVVGETLAALLLGAPSALAQVKDLLRAPIGDTSADYDRLVALSAATFAGGEAAEGLAARADKRAPSWTRLI